MATAFASSAVGATQRRAPRSSASQRRSTPESALTTTISATTGRAAPRRPSRAELEDAVEQHHPADEGREGAARLQAPVSRDQQAPSDELRDERRHAARLERAAPPREEGREVAAQPLRGGLRAWIHPARVDSRTGSAGPSTSRAAPPAGEGRPPPRGRATPRRRGWRRATRRASGAPAERLAQQSRDLGRRQRRHEPQARGHVHERDRVARPRRSTPPRSRARPPGSRAPQTPPPRAAARGPGGARARHRSGPAAGAPPGRRGRAEEGTRAGARRGRASTPTARPPRTVRGSAAAHG